MTEDRFRTLVAPATAHVLLEISSVTGSLRRPSMHVLGLTTALALRDCICMHEMLGYF